MLGGSLRTPRRDDHVAVAAAAAAVAAAPALDVSDSHANDPRVMVLVVTFNSSEQEGEPARASLHASFESELRTQLGPSVQVLRLRSLKEATAFLALCSRAGSPADVAVFVLWAMQPRRARLSACRQLISQAHRLHLRTSTGARIATGVLLAVDAGDFATGAWPIVGRHQQLMDFVTVSPGQAPNDLAQELVWRVKVMHECNNRSIN